ncbi:zinc finger protein 821 isoform X3 [Malaclemys terrapin pileata]|uniref:zinc finger protein 821 isoform X3 n=1 Tax=Malaclemys terrapin pileata TaxID=2991368 RepID=UPI0023A7D828|nr:zinc finger protein 821 isoform X3 [Malaclemys terrapin pileata]
MSRRKQTTPNKVHWEQVFAGLEEQARQAMMKSDFPGAFGDQRPTIHQLQDQDSSSSDSEGEEEETTQDEVSSHTSEEDGTMVKVKKEFETAEQPVAGNQRIGANEVTEDLNTGPMLGLSQCPLCQLECGSREQLIAHVYQHTAAVVSAKSYMCPVCGRALSSPGSLGRHLLIHSEDQLSNCAVCGAHFTSHATFNRNSSVWWSTRAKLSPMVFPCPLSVLEESSWALSLRAGQVALRLWIQ